MTFMVKMMGLVMSQVNKPEWHDVAGTTLAMNTATGVIVFTGNASVFIYGESFNPLTGLFETQEREFVGLAVDDSDDDGDILSGIGNE